MDKATVKLLAKEMNQAGIHLWRIKQTMPENFQAGVMYDAIQRYFAEHPEVAHLSNACCFIAGFYMCDEEAHVITRFLVEKAGSEDAAKSN